MELAILKKFKIETRIITVIVSVSIFVIIAMFVVAHAISRLNDKIHSQEKQLSIYMKTFSTGTQAVIKAKEAQKSLLQLEYDNLKNIFSAAEQSVYTQATPLAFKQQLFNVQDALAIKAKKNNVALPASIGFEDYKLNVPNASLAGLLMKELQIAEEIINALIDNGVYAINKIELPHEKTRIEHKSKQGSAVAFDSFSMDLSMEIKYQSLKKFLSALSESNNIYVLWKLEAKGKDEQAERIIVNFTIKTIEL